MNKDQLDLLESLQENHNYPELIDQVRLILKSDPSNFRHIFIKRWSGIRWRNIFLTEALEDKIALRKASKTKLPGFKDKRPDRQKLAEQFLRGDEIHEWRLELPEFRPTERICNTTLIFSPGLLNGMLPVRAFQSAFPKIEKELGIRILRADNHPMRGCKDNVEDLISAIEQGAGLAADTNNIPHSEQEAPNKVFLIGYSKGAPDIYELLARRPDLIKKSAASIIGGGAIGGSYLADDIYNSIKNLDIPRVEKALATFLSLVSPAINTKSGTLRRIEEYNVKEAIHDLTTHARESFLKDKRDFLESLDIPIFNITGSTTALEVPYFQMQGVMELNKYDAHNDMQLTQSQAKLKTSMSADIAVLNAHHWDMSYDAFPKLMRFGSPNLDHPFPKEAAMKAMIKLALELGLID